MKGIVSGNEELEGLIDESLFIKNYTGIEEQSAGAFGKVEAFVTGGYRWSAVGNAVRAMRGSYYTTRPYITEKKYKNLGWASEKRTYTEPEGKLYPDERARLLEKMENDTKTSQYGYSQLDLPGVFRHKTLTPITRLQSWWMNYFTNYLPEMTHRLFKGSVGYNPNLKLPMKDKVNILKYLFTVAPIMKKLGFKRSVLLGVLPTYMSPVSQLAIGLLQYLGADNDYQRDKAVRQMKGSVSATVPGSLAWKDFSSVWSGEKPLSSLFLYDTD